MFEEIHQGCAKVRMKELIQWNLNWNGKKFYTSDAFWEMKCCSMNLSVLKASETFKHQDFSLTLVRP